VEKNISSRGHGMCGGEERMQRESLATSSSSLTEGTMQREPSVMEAMSPSPMEGTTS
jgi:hypothetical protein